MTAIKIELDSRDSVAASAFAEALQKIASAAGTDVEVSLGGSEPAPTDTTPPSPPAADPAPATSADDETDAADVDSRGIEWDERIHSSNRKKLAKDGTWQRKRGVDVVLAERLESEAIAALNASSTPSQSETAIHDAKSVFGEDGPPPPPPAPAPTAWTYAELCEAVTKATSSGAVTMQQVQAACNNAGGVPALPPLSNNPDALTAVANELGLKK